MAGDDWQTPDWLVSDVRKLLGGSIDLDPCAQADNGVGATHYITKEQNGLCADWNAYKSVYVNPPYSRDNLAPFAEKFRRLQVPGVMLVPARTGMEWFHLCARYCLLFLFRGRVRFEGASASPAWDSVLFIVNVEPGQILQTLGDKGELLTWGQSPF